MPLIPLRPLLETVDKYHFAQGAFNVNAVAQAKAAIEVHEMFRSAAIIQGHAQLPNAQRGKQHAKEQDGFITVAPLALAPLATKTPGIKTRGNQPQSGGAP